MTAAVSVLPSHSCTLPALQQRQHKQTYTCPWATAGCIPAATHQANRQTGVGGCTQTPPPTSSKLPQQPLAEDRAGQCSHKWQELKFLQQTRYPASGRCQAQCWPLTPAAFRRSPKSVLSGFSGLEQCC